MHNLYEANFNTLLKATKRATCYLTYSYMKNLMYACYIALQIAGSK